MAALIVLLLNLVASLFKPKSQLEAENAALRQQLIVLQRKVRGRVQFTNSDRLFFIQLYRWFPSVLKAITIIRPGCARVKYPLASGTNRPACSIEFARSYIEAMPGHLAGVIPGQTSSANLRPHRVHRA
jgi:hypothetical protein